MSLPSIALLIESDGPGGAERVVATLATSLQQIGHRVLVVLPAGGEGWLADQLRDAPVTIDHFRLHRPVSLSTLRQIVAMIRDFGAGIVHSHEFSMAVYGGVAARLLRIPHVVTMHGGRYYAHRLRRRLALRWTVGRSSLVAVSGTLADHLSHDLRIPRGGIDTIANGVDVTAGLPDRVRSELALGDTAILLVAVGNLYPVKGHSYLLDAMAQLRSRPSPVHLAIAGRGDERAPLEAQAASLGLKERVHFLGLRNDVSDLLAAADLVVHPSLAEGLPITVLEAMAAGRPVVATAVGDVATALEWGQCGVLIPPADVAALVESIDALLDDPERRRGLATRARVRAHERYGVRGMIASYRRIYTQLAGMERDSPR